MENIEADQSYFLAEVNKITRKNFDKQLATIPPCTSIGPTLDIHENEMCSMKLHLDVGFILEREMMDQDYVVVDHGETSLTEDDMFRTRASIYKKATNNIASINTVHLFLKNWKTSYIFLLEK